MRNSPLVTEPMIQSGLPRHPWERVATYLFKLKGKKYIVMVDYIFFTLPGSHSADINYIICHHSCNEDDLHILLVYWTFTEL